MRFLIIIMQQSYHLRPIKDGRVFIQLVRRELGQPGYRYYVLSQNASKPISLPDGECDVELDTRFYPVFPRGGNMFLLVNVSLFRSILDMTTEGN